MSHSVLVETARRFVEVFYRELARGERVGEAMLEGQRALFHDKERGHAVGVGLFTLEDWFVPVLFQEGADTPLVHTLPTDAARELMRHAQAAQLGALPPSPPHTFVGRSRELLQLERLLLVEGYAVLLGEGGEGKSAVACEAARWLTRIRRVARVAFVSLEEKHHHDAVLDDVGRQLLGEANYAVKLFPDAEKALQPVERALRAQPTLLVLDNLETVLPPRPGGQGTAYDADELARLLKLFQRLGAVGGTKLLFTSREALPAPFDAGFNTLRLGALAPWDGVELVKKVLDREGITPFREEAQEEPTEREESQEREREKLLALVASVHGHARTLVLLAPELARSSLPRTTAQLHGLMASLEARYPGQRERSLYAGVALSLQRLPPQLRQAMRPLGVFQGGGHLGVIGHVLGMEVKEQLRPMVALLQQSGLCAVHEHGYLTLHFALCPFLWGELTPEEQATTRTRWLEGEVQFAGYLHGQYFQDPALAAALTLRDLPNLLAGLEQAAELWPSEQTMVWVSYMATLLQGLGQRPAQGRVATVREGLTARLGAGWSKARFSAEFAQVEHLGQQGQRNAAQQAAITLLQRCRNAGEGAYAEAPYDLALACLMAGHYAIQNRAMDEALPLLQEARARFLVLGGAAGDQSARIMAADALHYQGDAHRDLGRTEQAAQCYITAGQEQEKEGNLRGVAVSKGQLGTVRLRQRRYPEALAAYEEARSTFARLKEPAAVAGSWHQIGRLHQEMENWKEAEAAYREAIKLFTAHRLEGDQAGSLNQLGTLFDAQGHWEEAVVAYRQAAEISVRLQDLAEEGLVRNNLANTLLALGQTGEARQEIQRALVCGKPFGHAAHPWMSWYNLARIESTEGRAEAAEQARRQARTLYALYRRDRGESYAMGAQWCQATAAALQAGTGAEARQALTQVEQNPALPDQAKTLVAVLLQILDGSREPALADTPGLLYSDAVEVELLLEGLRG